MHDNSENELEELLKELNSSNILKEDDSESDIILGEQTSSIPLNEGEVKSFSFDDIVELPSDSLTDDTIVNSFSHNETDSSDFNKQNSFTEEGLSFELREKMMLDSSLNENEERITNQSEFIDLISEVIEEQDSYIEEVGSFHEIPHERTVDYLKLRFEEERQKSLLNVQNSVLSIQQEDEEISEYIFCEGLYTEHFKVFIHESPLIIKGNMPLVIELDEDYILYHRINPEPKVIQHLLNTLPNFKFTHVNGDTEKELTPFSFMDKCEFTV